MSVDALSLACNIITLVDFSHKFYETCRDIHDDSKPDQATEEISRELGSLSLKLQQSREAAGEKGVQNDQLLRIADQCAATAAKFQSEVAKLAPPSTSSSRISRGWNSFVSATKHTWRQDRLEKLIKTMRDYQCTMQTAILVDMYEKGQANLSSADIDNLDVNLQVFIQAVSRAQFQVSDLLAAKGQELHEGTRAVVRQEIAHLRDAQISDKDVARLRRSLKFPGFGQRYNEITDGHHGSFAWLFKDSGILDARHEASEDKTLQGETSIGGWEPWYITDLRDNTIKNFGKWLEAGSGSGMYWVSGKPGAGKSTLMKSIYGRLKETRSSNKRPHHRPVVLHHYFWLGNTDTRSRQNDIEGMFATLLYQLLDGHDTNNPTSSIVGRLLRDHSHLRGKDSYTEWNADELRAATFAAINVVSDAREWPIYILLDGLDEHLPADDHVHLIRLLADLDKLPRVRLIVSSRPELIFEKSLAQCQQLQLGHLTGPDIWRFCWDSLRLEVESAFGPVDSEQITSHLAVKIVSKADGVFLWARLAVDSVRRGLIHGNTETDLMDRLELMPSKLSDYFESIWLRLGDDRTMYEKKAANIFSLFLCDLVDEEPPLTRWNKPSNGSAFTGLERPDTLCIALALEPDVAHCLIYQENLCYEGPDLLQLCHRVHKTILSHCAGLLEFEQKQKNEPNGWASLHEDIAPQYPMGHWRFIHRTARDFLRYSLTGKRIMDSNDLGPGGPDVRLMSAFLARSVAFRTPPRQTTRCIMMYDLNINEFLSNLADWGMEHNIDSSQTNYLLSQCHLVYNHFFAPLDNPRFVGWQVLKNYNYMSIRTFATLAAYHGFDEYVESWLRNETCRGRSLSREFRDSLVKTTLTGHISRIHDNHNVRGKYRSNRMNTVISETCRKFLLQLSKPATVSSATRYAATEQDGDPEVCLPQILYTPETPPTWNMDCIIRKRKYSSSTWQLLCVFIEELANSRQDVLLDILAKTGYFNRRDPKVLYDVIIQLIRAFLTGYASRLQSRIICVYQLRFEGSSLWTVGDVIFIPRFLSRKPLPWKGRESETKWDIAFETTPMWLLRWFILKMSVPGQGCDATHNLTTILQEAVNKGTEPEKARLLELYRYTYDGVETSWYKAQGLSTELASYLMEPLNQLAETNTAESTTEALRSRIVKSFSDAAFKFDRLVLAPNPWTLEPRKQTHIERDIEKDVVPSISDEELARLAERCYVRLSSSNSVLREGIVDETERFIVPPKGASEEDEDLSYFLMREFV